MSFRDIERPAMLGISLGLLVGSLVMWRTDTTAAASGTACGLGMFLIMAITWRARYVRAIDVAVNEEVSQSNQP